MRRLISNDPRLAERLEVHSINAIGGRLYKAHFGQCNLASRETIRELVTTAAKKVPDHKFSTHFLLSEWDQVADAWQLTTWEAYRDVVRLGRKTRLPEQQRKLIWQVFEKVRTRLAAKKLITQAEMFTKLAAAIQKDKNPPFDFAIVDEAQDFGVAHLRFFAAIGAHRGDALFFAGDLGQRIFQQPFSWLALGVDIRGRSRNLRINCRTSHQIRTQSDRLLGPEVSDADGNTEQRGDTVSVFNGPKPVIQVFDSADKESAAVSEWIIARLNDGVAPHELAVFMRSEQQFGRAQQAVEKTDKPFKFLDENVETTNGHVAISTMHLAKGLEFRAVAVMACDDEILPLQERIQSVTDDSDLQEVYNTERASALCRMHPSPRCPVDYQRDACFRIP